MEQPLAAIEVASYPITQEAHTMQDQALQLTTEITGSRVIYRGSLQRLDGGWDTIEINLPLGAPDDMIDQAIEQWQRQRAKGMAALVQPSRDTNGGASYTPPARPAQADPPITEKQIGMIGRQQAALVWTDQQIDAYAQAHGAAETIRDLTKPQAIGFIDNLIAIVKGNTPSIEPPRIASPVTMPAAAQAADAPPPSDADAPAADDESEDMPF